ncbi:hypothetical protein [Subtercola boreus]|nr:hypothetical protein [Subtercola boreus]
MPSRADGAASGKDGRSQADHQAMAGRIEDQAVNDLVMHDEA